MSRSSRLRTASFWRQLVLNTGAVVGSLCILATIATTLFGVTPLVFRSGSMSPAIPTGALALAHRVPADRVHVGDIVSVVDGDGTRVTHRVAAIRRGGAAATLVLKGDANHTVDLDTYHVTSVDRVFASAPRLGYVVAAVGSPYGVFLGVVFVVVALFLGFGGRGRGQGEPRASRGTALRLATVAVVAVAVGAVAVPLMPTMAYFSDQATMASGTFSMVQPTATTYCKVETAGGTTVSGFTCAVTAASCSTWSNGTNTYADLTLSFTGSDPGQYDGSQQVVYRVNLASLGCSPAGWSWTKAGTLAASGQINPVSGYQCSSLPALEASSPRWVIGSTAYTQIVMDRTGSVQGTVDCS